MKRLAAVLACGLQLASPIAAWTAPAGLKPPTRAQLKACPLLAPIDFTKIKPVTYPVSAEVQARFDDSHVRTRGPYGAFTPPADAQVVLRIWAGGSETQEYRTDTSSVVWKGGDGIWRVNRVDRVNRPPPPPPPPPADWDGKTPYFDSDDWDYEKLARDVYEGVLPADRVAVIEKTLADPCFALQPDALPMSPPVRRGVAPLPPCWGVIGGVLEIRWADGRQRNVAELCGGYYASGIISAVMYARPAG